ncbi:MAG: hypothetical protein K5917_01975 [Clostridiales bacterium]|nr:hypothetical protein [Clostridiales bacterium]
MAFAAETTNSGTLQTNAGAITFSAKVNGASGTITSTSGNINASAASPAESYLGTVSTSGVLKNSGNGAVTVKEFSMGGNTSVTNSSTGSVTVTKLTGNHIATLSAATGSVTVSGYDESAVPSVTVATNNVSLGTGTIDTLNVASSVTATISGDLVVDGATTNTGTISVGANTITFKGTAEGSITATTGTITTNNDATFESVHINGGKLINAGSGVVTATTFTIGANNATIQNSASGEITVTTLTGAYTATLKSVSADNGITVSGYGATTKIVVDENSKNILLAGGTGVTLDTLTIGTDAKATITGDITTTSGITNSGTLATSAALAISGTVTNNGTVNAGANNITFNGAIESGATGKITTTTGNITTDAAAPSELGTIQSTGGSLTNSGAGAVTVANFDMGAATTITNNPAGGGISITKLSGAQTATLHNESSANAITVSSYANTPTIIVDAGSSILGTQTETGTITALTVNAGATATVTGALTVSGNISNEGTMTASAAAASVKMTGAAASFSGNTTTTIRSFSYAPTDTTGTGLAISGANKFTDFSCTTGGTLTISDEQGVSGTLTLRGASESSPLAITGTADGAFNISSNQSSGRYLKVDRDLVSIGGKFFKATDSVYNTSDEDKKYGVHQNWILMNSAMKYIWTGATSSEWEKTSNWKCNLIPGKNHGTGDASDNVNTQGVDVIIPDAPSGGRFPVAAAGYTLGNLTVGGSSHLAKLTISAPGSSTAAGNHIKVSGDFKNYGRIIYTNTGRITKQNATPYAFTNDDENQGTVEFTVPPETATGIDLASVPYWNLEITGSGTYTANAGLTVKNALIVSGESAASAGSVNFNASAGATATTVKTARFNTSGTISFGNDANDSFEVKNGALELPAALDTLGGLTLAGKIKASGGISLPKNAMLTSTKALLAANTTFESPTKLSGDITLSGAFTVTNAAAATLNTSEGVLILENANLVNTGAVTSGQILFTETGSRSQTFTPFSSTYDNVTVNKTSGGSLKVAADMNAATFDVTKNGSLTFDNKLNATNFTVTENESLEFKDAVTVQNLSITQNTSADFAALVTVGAAYSDATTAGNIHFNAGCSFTPATEFKTTGTVTLNGSTATTAPCAFNGGLKHTAGTTILYGALNTSNKNIELETTTLAADTTINAGTNVAGTVKFQGTVDGSYDFVSSGNGLLTFGGKVGATNSLKTITVTGPTKVSTDTITTTGLQLYKGDMTFAADCTVTGTVQAAAGIITSGAYNVTFANDVWLYTSAPAALGGNGGSLAITENLFFVGKPKAISVNSNVTAKNVLLLHGTLDIAAAATLASSTGDIILLGPDYGIDDDKDGAAASQVAGLFAYKPAAPFARKLVVSYTAAFPTNCPDETDVSPDWSGAVTTNAGATISAGQNFYANGLTSLGSGAWTLLLTDNGRQDSAFAEIYNSTITNCTANYKVAAAENNTASGCSANIVTSRPVIAQAWTVYDDVIYIAFKDSISGNPVTIENSCDEISAAAAQISYYGGNFVSTWTDADCQHSTNGAGDISSFYIKSSSTWNTDAYEISKGAAESSDRSGAGRATIPCLNLPKALTTVYETLRDSSKNRIAHYYSATPDTSAVNNAPGKTFTAVADKCAPVLIKVLTGQELHESTIASQTKYDAHNFVEFVYSEPVTTSGGTTSVLASDTNIRAANDLGATTNNASGITFAGLATCAAGSIDAAVKTGSGSPHSLYRNFSTSAGGTAADQAARIRLSIAGYVDGTVSSEHGPCNNWIGYISSATSPSGSITRIANSNIKDLSSATNSLDANSTQGHPLPTLTVQNSESELYGTWDVTPPSFAPIRINGTTKWEQPAFDGSQEFEFVGASYATGTLSAIELHWFDNQPTYNESLQWFTKVGWAQASSETECSTITSYAADVRGGSKQDSSEANATKGGIRFCSLYNANNAFKYALDGTNEYFDFTQNIKAGAESSLFTYAGSDSGAATHTTGAEDGLYCKLLLDQSGYSLQTTFQITFDSNQCYVTDLAGNRIQCGQIKMKSIDRTPPAFTLSAVPLGTKDMLIVFSKSLNTDSLTLYNSSTDYTKVSALEYIPKSLLLTDASGTNIQIAQDTPAKLLFKTKKATGLLITLTQDAVLNDITKGVFVTAKSVAYTYDPLAGITAPITYIQDAIGNYVVGESQHAFSDFAVNAIQPQYAYDNSLTDEGAATGYGLYQEGSWAVRDWNAEQANYGTISANKEIILQASLYDGTSDNSGGFDKSQIPTAFFSAKPDAASVSTEINKNTDKSWRIWLPNFTQDIFGSLAPANNKSCVSIDGSANDSGAMFDIPKETASSNFKSGDQVSFIFKYGNYTVDHFANGTNYPLYAVRLKDLNDITSLDLWSFKVKETTLQRGGVTILNNVIDVNNGENTVVQVDMKESGNLNVIVMTLDGNVIKYLRHGYTDAGTHYYNWNGTNNGGSKVARGLYFVRVIGPGIDETRKVMCVK